MYTKSLKGVSSLGYIKNCGHLLDFVLCIHETSLKSDKIGIAILLKIC